MLGGVPAKQVLTHAQNPGAQAKRFTPFGNGIRNCVGMQLSKMNIPTAVAMIVSQFKLALSPEVSCMLVPGSWPAMHPALAEATGFATCGEPVLRTLM